MVAMMNGVLPLWLAIAASAPVATRQNTPEFDMINAGIDPSTQLCDTPMTQAQVRPITFQQYLEYNDGSDTLYDLHSNGELIAESNESELNDYLARLLMVKLSAIVDLRLIITHSLTMEVKPVGDSYRNRRPDLVVLRPEHLILDSIVKRTALPLGSLPPQLVVEIVSPGSTTDDNYRRDYEWKRQQYESWGIPEYWILDLQRQKVTVLTLVYGYYQETVYTQADMIQSLIFPALKLMASDLLQP